MKHQPTLLDAATDLQRCIYATFSEQGTNDPNFKVFLLHSQKIINQLEKNIDEKVLRIIKQRLNKAQHQNNSLSKAREDLLTAASLLHAKPTNSLT